jgi:beta-lactamase class D
MKYSVLWYSQRITHALGAETMAAYLDAFDYGNRDFSGDQGFNNALERAWVSSSLTISAREQAGFLSRMLGRSLPVSQEAFENTLAIIDAYPADGGWTLRGKTGGAYPRNGDRSFDYAAGWGWFIGWAERDGRTLIFATLSQDETRVAGSPGIRARDAFVAQWPALAVDF